MTLLGVIMMWLSGFIMGLVLGCNYMSRKSMCSGEHQAYEWEIAELTDAVEEAKKLNNNQHINNSKIIKQEEEQLLEYLKRIQNK